MFICWLVASPNSSTVQRLNSTSQALDKDMKLHKTLKLLFFWLFSIWIMGEIALRSLGYQPGIMLQPHEIRQNWVKLDGGKPSLVGLFEPDSLGLFKPKMPLPENVFLDTLIYGSLHKNLINTTINPDGFRGFPFDTFPEGKTKVLFLGDSFTFGFDATPLRRSFVDQFGEMNPCLHPLNGGIPGGDLATYAKVAEVYIPKIKPEIVVVCLYANDRVFYPKKLSPGQISDIFMTDKGVLFKENNFYKKDSIQVFANAEEAYHALLSEYTTRYISPRSLKWMLDRSVFLAQCYEWLDIRCHQRFGMAVKKANHSIEYTDQISAIVKAYGGMPLFTIIPHRSDLEPEHNMEFFRQMVQEDTPLYFPEGITLSHYGAAPRIHFNNEGHAFYAEFLTALLLGAAESSDDASKY